MADKIRNISGSKCFLLPLWTKWTGIFMNCQDDRSLMSARILALPTQCPETRGLEASFELGKELRVGCTVQWCVWIFPVSVRTICLPSSLNFLQPRVTLTQVRARGESWDGITITKNIIQDITQDKNIYKAFSKVSFESLWILTQCFALLDLT